MGTVIKRNQSRARYNEGVVLAALEKAVLEGGVGDLGTTFQRQMLLRRTRRRGRRLREVPGDNRVKTVMRLMQHIIIRSESLERSVMYAQMATHKMPANNEVPAKNNFTPIQLQK